MTARGLADGTNASISLTLVVLVLAQFIITVDTTFMNVSISALVKDLNTTVTGVQSAITFYALVMAALMIAGAKCGDMIGRKKAFVVGLIIYGAGTTVTSIAGSLLVFIFGWSVLEGAGAALMLPAMMSLIADNFAAGPARAKAYGAFAATAGIAAAIGPVVGGLFTTYLSWRLAFAAELLVVLFILLNRRAVREQVLTGPRESFDWPGFIVSALGLVTVVQGIILASTYGLVQARTDVVLGGLTLIRAGSLSPTVWLVLLGLLILLGFGWIETRRAAQRKATLLDVQLLKNRAVSAGSATQLVQALVLTGVIFALSLYTQMQLAYDAIASGLTLVPLSVGVLAISFLASRVLGKRFAPRWIILAGFVLIVLGTLSMGLVARDASSGIDFMLGLLLIGAGVGCVVSQNQNLIISAVSPQDTNEVSGLVTTFQNIGSSLGTSIAGAVIVAVFVSTATSLVNSPSTFTPAQKAQLDQAIVTKAQILSDKQLAGVTASLPSDMQTEITTINRQARQRSLAVVYAVIGLVGALGLVSAALLPKTPPLATHPPAA